MLHKVKPHVRKHGKKYLALTLMLALSVVLFQFRPSQFQTTRAAAYAQWGSSPITINDDQSMHHEHAWIEKTSDGYFITAWMEDSDLFAQKLDINGTTQWFSDIEVTLMNGTQPQTGYYGFNLVDMESDGSGGTYLAYGSYDATDGYNTYVTRLSGSGSVACSAQLTGTADQKETLVNIYPDGSNGVYAVWLDETSWTIYMKRVDNTCSTSSWNSGNALTVFSGGSSLFNLDLTEDSSGNLFVAFQDWDSGNGYGIAYAVKVDPTAPSVSWTSTGVTDTYNFTSAPDGNGGLILFYTLDSTGAGQMQRLDSSGNPDWGPTSFTSGSSIDAMHAVKDPASDNVFYVWYENDGTNWTSYIIKITSTGTLTWPKTRVTDNGATMTGTDDRKGLVPDGLGGVFIAYHVYIASETRPGVQYIKNDQTKAFDASGIDIDVDYTSLWSYYPDIALGGSEEVVMAFTDRPVWYQTEAQLFSTSPPPPQVEAVTPDYDSTAGGTSVNITGNYFTDATAVTVGGTACSSFTVNTETDIDCTVPAGTAGTADIVVTTPSGNSGTTGQDLFTYYGVPTVTSIDPTSGVSTGGTEVIIYGSGFGEQSTVTVGGNPATVTDYASDELTIITPAGTAETTVDVIVTNPGSQSDVAPHQQFTYTVAPEKWSIPTIIGGETNTNQDIQAIHTSDDNYIVTWMSSIAEGETNLYIKKVNKSDGATFGTWNSAGTKVTLDTVAGVNEPYGNAYQVISDGAGGAYVIWAHPVPGGKGYVGSPYLQHYFSDGSTWASPVDLMSLFGKDLDSETASDFNMVLDDTPTTVSGQGDIEGVFISWYSTQSTTEESVEVVRVNANGNAAYATPTILPNYYNRTGENKIINDGSGNAIVVHYNNNEGTYNMYSYRITSAGAIDTTGSWSGTGTLISDSSITNGYGDIQLVTDNSAGAILAYTGSDGTQTLVKAQKINSDGTITWNSGGTGVTLSDGLTNYDGLNAVSDGAGGLYAIWNDDYSGFGVTREIFGQYVNSSGTPQWGNKYLLTLGGGAEAYLHTDYNKYNLNVDQGSLIYGYESFDPLQFTRTAKMQKVDNTGTAQWPEDTPSLDAGYTAGGDQSTDPAIAGDGAGGAAIFFPRFDGSTETTYVQGQYYEGEPAVTVTVTNVNPSYGPTAGGTAVTITGTNFVDQASVSDVTFDGVSCAPYVVVSDTEITCSTPAHAEGSVDVVVTSTTYGSGTLTNGFTYSDAACGPVGPNQQCGLLNLEGTVDIWYDGYGAGADIQDLTFQDGTCDDVGGSSDNITISATQEVPTYTAEHCGTLSRTDLVGVTNQRGQTWNLQVQANENFVGPGGEIIPISGNMRVATTGNDTNHFGGVGAMTVTNATPDDLTLTNHATDDIWYYTSTNSGYTYEQGDVTATLNTTADLQTLGTYSTEVNTTGITILSTDQTDAYGIFTVAPVFELDVPAGTAAVTYTNTITYTVS